MCTTTNLQDISNNTKRVKYKNLSKCLNTQQNLQFYDDLTNQWNATLPAVFSSSK